MRARASNTTYCDSAWAASRSSRVSSAFFTRGRPGWVQSTSNAPGPTNPYRGAVHRAGQAQQVSGLQHEPA